MKTNIQLHKLPDLLLPWYRQVKRDLPWRKDREPYHIWLSEIMLQQTRVEAVKGYYDRFLQALPTVEDLAKADDDRLHKLWEGLGYYSRVRNLKKAAVSIMKDHGGIFPKTYEAVRSLPGIGDYTAGAICSIAYDLPTPAVDGNVLRLMSRLLNDATPIETPAFKKQIHILLSEIYPKDAGAFTQALMELGATLCGPNTKPACENCPCKAICQAYAHQTAESLPVRMPKKKRREEDKTILILRCQDRYALVKRPDSGLLASMWQFPELPGKLSLESVLKEVERIGLKPTQIERQVERKHIFTHIQWNMRGYYMEISNPIEGYIWFTGEELNATAALPTAFRQFWEEIIAIES